MKAFQPFTAGQSLMQALQARPDLAAPLLELSEAVMRDTGPLDPVERELVFAYVSGLNGCGFCRDSHTAVLSEYGVDTEVVDALIDRRRVEGRALDIRAVLRYAARLTEDPEGICEIDARELREAGWDDADLAQIAWICALAGFYNRLVQGLGIAPDPELTRWGGRQLHRHGYRALRKALGRGGSERKAAGS